MSNRYNSRVRDLKNKKGKKKKELVKKIKELVSKIKIYTYEVD